MNEKIVLFHGSENIIEKPYYGGGKKTNDFGLGFYCTESINLAKEWAVSSMKDGFCNKYSIDTSYMRILNLNTSKYNILNWLAVLLENRVFSIKTPIAKKARNYIIENFGINVNAYDIIIGYRADDSYYDYAEAFINNSISIEQLSKAMRLGKLGEQIVIKSQFAFSSIVFEGFEIALKDEFYKLRKERDKDANELYYKLLEEDTLEGLYINDIMKRGIKNEDSRIPRNVSK